MSKTELIINSTLPETRIALLEDGEIQELHIERDTERGIVGNIYKGKVIRVLPGMQAAFVDIGLDKAAFLYVDDIVFPDMENELVANPLPENSENILQDMAREREERGLPAVAERTVQPRIDSRERSAFRSEPNNRTVVVSPNNNRNRNQRNPRYNQKKGRMRPGQRRSQGTLQLRNTHPMGTGGPIPPESPEAHALLQQQYARQMLEYDDESEANLTGTVQPVTSAAAPASDSSVFNQEAESTQSQDVVSSSSEKAFEEPAIEPEAWVEDVAHEHVRHQQEEMQSEEGVLSTEQQSQSFANQEQTEESQNVATEETSVDSSAPFANADEDTSYVSVSQEVSNDEVASSASDIENVEPAFAPMEHHESIPVVEEVEEEESEEDEGRPIPRRKFFRREQANIADLVKEGQEIIVQVAKDPIGTKGARLTCHVSLPGRYLVFMPTVDHIGVSRRIESDLERRRLKEIMFRMRPARTGVIVRTASGKQADKKLKADLDYLVTTWNEIQKKFQKQKAPCAVYQDLTIVLRAIRDMFTDEVDKVIVDSPREHKSIMKFVNRFIPHVKDKIELYEGNLPIFDAYGIEPEISRSLERKVWLKSGGYLVVDQAEALVAIDVNTGRYVGKKTLEETILKTNLEAVKEIAYQLRLRNFGGIIILDLIDMERDSNKEKVYKALEEELKKDRARPTILKISQLGLIEMTRKRTRDSMVRSLCEPCSYCDGKGFVKNKLTIAYDILRDIEREGKDTDTTELSIQCHPGVADVLQEEKQDILQALEHEFNKKINIRGNGAYHVEQYELVAHRDSKNMVWSSDERKQIVRSRIQDHFEKKNKEEKQKREKENAQRREEREKQRLEREEERKLERIEREAQLAGENSEEQGSDEKVSSEPNDSHENRDESLGYENSEGFVQQSAGSEESGDPTAVRTTEGRDSLREASLESSSESFVEQQQQSRDTRGRHHNNRRGRFNRDNRSRNNRGGPRDQHRGYGSQGSNQNRYNDSRTQTQAADQPPRDESQENMGNAVQPPVSATQPRVTPKENEFDPDSIGNLKSSYDGNGFGSFQGGYTQQTYVTRSSVRVDDSGENYVSDEGRGPGNQRPRPHSDRGRNFRREGGDRSRYNNRTRQPYGGRSQQHQQSQPQAQGLSSRTGEPSEPGNTDVGNERNDNRGPGGSGRRNDQRRPHNNRGRHGRNRFRGPRRNFSPQKGNTPEGAGTENSGGAGFSSSEGSGSSGGSGGEGNNGPTE